MLNPSPKPNPNPNPNRRYADQLVHRMLAASIGWDPPSAAIQCAKEMQAHAQTLNERHSSAKDAERASVELFSTIFFKGEPRVEKAFVMQVKPTGLSVLIPKYGIEGWVWASDGDQSPFAFDEATNVLSAPRPDGSTHTLRAMDAVMVRISVEPNRLRPRVNIELVDGDGDGETPVLELLTGDRDAGSPRRLKAPAAPAA